MHKIQASTDLIHTFSQVHWQQLTSDLSWNNEHVHLEIGPPGLDTNITMIVDIAVMHWRAEALVSCPDHTSHERCGLGTRLQRPQKEFILVIVDDRHKDSLVVWNVSHTLVNYHFTHMQILQFNVSNQLVDPLYP